MFILSAARKMRTIKSARSLDPKPQALKAKPYIKPEYELVTPSLKLLRFGPIRTTAWAKTLSVIMGVLCLMGQAV